MTDGVWPHTGAVLAGGDGARLGRPKYLLINGDGSTFLDSITTALTTICREVVIVGAIDTDLAQIPDLRKGKGPLAGIEAVLASGLDDQYLVCPVDMPLLTPELLEKLTSSTEKVGTIFEIAGETRTQSLPVRLSAGALPAVSDALDRGRLALHHLWQELAVERIPLTVVESAGLRNINTVADYERLRATTS